MKTQKTKTEILKTEILKSGFQISAFQRFGVSAFRCSMFPFFRRHSLLLLFIFLFAGALTASAQTNLTTGFGPVQITLGSNNGPQDVDSGIKILFFMTLLSL